MLTRFSHVPLLVSFFVIPGCSNAQESTTVPTESVRIDDGGIVVDKSAPSAYSGQGGKHVSIGNGKIVLEKPGKRVVIGNGKIEVDRSGTSMNKIETSGQNVNSTHSHTTASVGAAKAGNVIDASNANAKVSVRKYPLNSSFYTGDAISVSGNRQQATIPCNGKSVSVAGNQNQIQLEGSCGVVSVEGNRNSVEVSSAPVVLLGGNRNELTVFGNINVQDSGNRNLISRQ